VSGPRSLETLAETVAPQVLLDAIEASRRLTELGVPHALIGGLAVGLYGHPRATKDVDYLVGASAFDQMSPLLVFRAELRDLARVGVIDFMPLPLGHPELAADLRVPSGDEIPVIGPEGLVLMKLLANRVQDRADIIALLDAGISAASVTIYLRANATQFVTRFAELVSEVE
jgi:hypothetical protein